MNVEVPNGLPGCLCIVDANIEAVWLMLKVQLLFCHIQQAKDSEGLFFRQIKERSHVPLRDD
jgi:hypothetical protein